jgi:two-component system response regulator HydG
MQTSRAGHFASLPYMRPVDGEVFARAEEAYRNGDYAAAEEMLERAAAATGATGDVTLGQALVLLAWVHLRQFEPDACRQVLDRAVHGAGMPADDSELVLIGLWLAYFDGHYTAVIERAQQYLQTDPRILDRVYGQYLLLAGNAKEKVGEVEESIEDRIGSYAIFRLLDELELIIETTNQLGRVFLVISDYPEALKWYQRCLTHGQATTNAWQIGYTKLNIGVTYYKLGRYAAAAAELADAITSLRESTSGFARLDLCRATIALGNVHRLQRDFDAARRNLTRAYTMASELRVPREECLALEFLGDVYRDEEQPEAARRYYARGLAIAESIAPEGDLVPELLRRDGECHVLAGNVDEALPILARARVLAGKLGDRFEEGVALRCLAQATTATDDFAAAQEYAEASIRLLSEIAARHELAIAHLTAAEAHFARAARQASNSAPHRPEEADRVREDAGTLPILDDAWRHAVTAQHLCQELGVAYWLREAQKSLAAVARKRVDELKRLQRAAVAVAGVERPIISASQAMADVLQLIDAFAPYEEPILITGATGVGKELVARRIHTHSKRRDRQFVAVNVAAIPSTMFEREFFGHVKGAFSGADSDQPGFAGEANGGTMFLDEIGDMPPETQVKLLRLLQDGSYKCLGDPDERFTDIRLVAATNARLLDRVEDGRFRADLYYRLRILEIFVPPLSERSEDIVPLLEHFLSQSAGYPVNLRDYFNPTSVRALHEYPWPGNVRELATVARRAYITMEAQRRVDIEIGFPPHRMRLTGPGEADLAAAEAQGGGSDGDALTRSRLLLVLAETDGNRAEAARRLGISRATLYRKLNRFGI